MKCQLSKMWFRLGGILLLEDIGYALMEPRSSAWRHGVVERLAHQVMGESDASRRTADRDQQARGAGIVDCVQDVARAAFVDRSEQVEAELRAENSTKLKGALPLLAQVSDTSRNDIPDSRGHLDSQGGQLGGGIEPTLRRQEADCLPDE